MTARQRDARRWVRRRLAVAAREIQRDPGVSGDPDVRAARQAAAGWAAEYLAPGETNALPLNLQALVTPDGTAPDGVDPSTWRTSHDAPEHASGHPA